MRKNAIKLWGGARVKESLIPDSADDPLQFVPRLRAPRQMSCCDITPYI